MYNDYFVLKDVLVQGDVSYDIKNEMICSKKVYSIPMQYVEIMKKNQKSKNRIK